MTKIFLMGAGLSGNLGGPSLLISTCKVLKKKIPDAEFKFHSASGEKTTSNHVKKYVAKYGVKRVETRGRYIYLGFFRSILWANLNKFRIKGDFLLKDRWLKEYKSSDIILDIRGITLTDYFQSKKFLRDWWIFFGQNIPLLTAAFLQKPVIKFTQDMGPFKNKINKFSAKLCLNRLNLIMARGEITKKLLQEIGIKKPIYVLPDTAFVLDPAPIEEINEILVREKINKKPLIGIVPSRQVERIILSDKDPKLQNNYTLSLAQLADYMIENFNTHIVLIPNEISPQNGGYDDIYVAKKVYKKVRNKSEVRVITSNYYAEQLKGIIGKCDLLIGSRYHSIVAALSMCVPTLVIGWGFKYDQIMGMMEQGEFVCDYKNVTFTELQTKVDKLWHDKEKIKKELASKMPSIKETVFSGGKIVKDLMDTSKHN